MLKIGSIVWGVRDLQRGIEFWSEALSYRLREEPRDDWAVLVPRDGEGQQVALMQVAAPSEHRRRHHLDLDTEDQDGEVRRLTALGATDVDWDYEPDADYVVLADPDGNYFCVVQK
jgi:predicted enzyme related to lactoylglutathione lyase